MSNTGISSIDSETIYNFRRLETINLANTSIELSLRQINDFLEKNPDFIFTGLHVELQLKLLNSIFFISKDPITKSNLNELFNENNEIFRKIFKN